MAVVNLARNRKETNRVLRLSVRPFVVHEDVNVVSHPRTPGVVATDYVSTSSSLREEMGSNDSWLSRKTHRGDLVVGVRPNTPSFRTQIVIIER